MRLRTRIICISCVAFLCAMILSEFAIWMYVDKNMEKEAVFKGYRSCYEFTSEIRKNIAGMTDFDTYESYLKYFFKQNSEDIVICLYNKGEDRDKYDYDEENAELEQDVIEGKKVESETQRLKKMTATGKKSGVKEIYNTTTLKKEEVTKLSFKEYLQDTAEGIDENTIYYASMNKDGGRYLVYSQEIGHGTTIYKIEDITYVKEQMLKMVAVMLMVTAVIAIFIIIVLSLILRKALKPLDELSKTAVEMSRGRYDHRVNIKRMDEVGQLGESFNKMADAVEARTKSLQESEQKKTIFMGNLTHELKTPMTAISGYAQTLLMAKVSEEDRKEALMYIVDECGRLERLSKKMMELLDISNENKIASVNISAGELFEAAEKSCKAVLENKKITLEIQEHGESFVADIDLMSDVIINLIDNAVKASQPGGKIILKAYDNCIEVQDFGIGIPKEEQEKILEPFYMVDKSRSRKNGGAGLGLALVYAITEKYNIKLSIISNAGEGSRFILKFQ